VIGESLDVVLHIDEARAPLVRGQEIVGKIIDMVPLSLPPSNRQGILEPESNAYPFLHGRTLYVSPRYQGQEWDYFRVSNEIVVNVTLLDSERTEVAAGIGSLRRVK
jgi:hypothetical protein